MTIHATKLHRPRPRATWLARPRLLAPLDRALADGRRLILISAPAGAGKTTLLGHWLAQHPVRAAWLSLDLEDDDPCRFWRCVVAALQTVSGGLGEWMLEVLQASAPPPLSVLLPRLLNEIGEQVEPLLLVLDDYHVLAAAAIHESMTAAIDHLPESLRLVICTRADPPLPLARWRARGELAEVRAADLRFTDEEALALLNGRMALALQAEDARQLVERTEGWAVGLQLAGLSLQGQADPRQAIQSFAASRRYMLEYLLEEVLARQPQARQNFLLHTSILHRMCGALCDAVTGAEGGAATLLDLLRQNLFVVPLDEERVWFRYHHLFAELLRARLRQSAPDQVHALHKLAATWCAQHGLPVEAVQHALAAEDWDRAARLLEEHEHDWWTGSDVSVMNMLPHLPDKVVLRGPNLSVYKAWFLLIRGQLPAAANLLAAVEGALHTAPVSAEQTGLLSFVRMQQAYIAEISGTPHQLALDTAGLTAGLAAIPDSRGGMRNSAEVILAYVLHRAGDFMTAERLLLATIERDVHTGATNGIPIAASRLARMWIVEGRLQEAAALCRRCLAIVQERGTWRFFVAGNLGICLGDILREWDQLDEAEAWIAAGIQDNESWQVAHAYALGYSALGRLRLARGDTAGAASALAHQAHLTSGRTIPPDLAAETRALQVRLALAVGDQVAVAAWVEEWRQVAGVPCDFRNEQDQLTWARAALALGDAPQALRLLERQAAAAGAGGRARWLAECVLLSAVAWEMQGEQHKALTAVERALTLAAPLGCTRLFLEGPLPVRALVAAVASSRGTPPAVQRFARTITGTAPCAITATTGAAIGAPLAAAALAEPSSLVETLTAREQEVLRLLAAGNSNQDIAEQLVITVHAVKKHTGNIYGKLGVTSRTQAIARARALRIIA